MRYSHDNLILIHERMYTVSILFHLRMILKCFVNVYSYVYSANLFGHMAFFASVTKVS